MVDGAENIHGMADGRIKFDACIHAEYTNNDVTAKTVFDWAKENNTRMHVHVSETQSEVEGCRERHGGKSPVQWLESLGAFDVPAIAAHCVWVDADDIKILAKHGVTVAYNPASNMKLSSGFAPVARMLDAGVNVALGTDGMASNNNHDMFQDMYLMAMLPKGCNLDPTLVTPQQALYGGPSWCPANDVPTNVVYAGHGSDVVLTLCDGNVVYRDGVWPTIDLESVKAEVAERTERIQKALAESA